MIRIRTIVSPLRSLLAMLLLLVPALAQGTQVETAADWKVAKERFEREYATGTEAKRLAAVRRLGGCDYVPAVEMLIQLIARPDPRIRSLQKEQVEAQKEFEDAYAAYLADAKRRNDGTVLRSLGVAMEQAQRRVEGLRERMSEINQVPAAAEAGLARTTVDDGIIEICKAATAHKAWTVRAACARALGKIGGDLAESTVLVAAADDVTMVRMAVATSLGALAVADSVDELAKMLDDAAWQVRAAAVSSLEKLHRREAVKPLIDHLAGEEGRLREDIDDALASLTGVDLHGDHEQWLSWWDVKGDAFMTAPPEPEPEPEETAELAEGEEGKEKKGEEEKKDDGEEEGDEGKEAGADPEGEESKGDESKSEDDVVEELPDDAETVTFYGIRTKSKRILFVVDISGSMGEPAGKAESSKLDVAKQQLEQAIRKLESDALLNVLVYSDDCHLFRPKKMIRADEKGKKTVLKKVASLAPMAGTNIHDALDLGFRLAGRDAKKGRRPEDGIDTIFFLSDGKPSVGGMTDARKIADAVKSWNVSVGIKIHTIGVGKGHSRRFMERLATESGGKYVAPD